MIEAYPLHWPTGYPRTSDRRDSRFRQTLGFAHDYLKEEVKRVGGTDLIISTNLPTKDNGDLRADYGRYKIEDPGVAIYFKRNGQDVVFCCDTYNRVWENIYALGRSLESMRQINRDGVSDFLNRVFTGFPGLPASTETESKVWQTLGFASKPESFDMVEKHYKVLAKKLHPDIPGGSADEFQELRKAYDVASKLFNK